MGTRPDIPIPKKTRILQSMHGRSTFPRQCKQSSQLSDKPQTGSWPAYVHSCAGAVTHVAGEKVAQASLTRLAH